MGLNILLVDDSGVMRVSKALAGQRTSEAANGAEGRPRALRLEHAGDGLTFVTEARKSSRVPIIMLTTESGEDKMAAAVGANGYMSPSRPWASGSRSSSSCSPSSLMIGGHLLARQERHGSVFADLLEASARADAIQIGPDIETAAAGLGSSSAASAFPNTLVIEVIADLLMIPEPARITKAKEGLSENDVEAFREMANLLCGSWNRIFQDFERDLRISQSVDDRWTGEKDGALTSCFGEGRVAYVAFEVDCARVPAIMALPFGVAVDLAEFYAEAA